MAEDDKKIFSLLRRIKLSSLLFRADVQSILKSEFPNKSEVELRQLETNLIKRYFWAFNPSLYVRYRKKYRIIFLDAVKFFDTKTRILNEFPGLNVYTVYGEFDYVISGFVSDELLDSMMGSLGQYCVRKPVFTVEEFYRYRLFDCIPNGKLKGLSVLVNNHYAIKA